MENLDGGAGRGFEAVSTVKVARLVADEAYHVVDTIKELSYPPDVGGR